MDNKKIKKNLDFFFKDINSFFIKNTKREKVIKVFRFNRFLIILFFFKVLRNISFFNFCLFSNFIFYFYSHVLTKKVEKKIINLILMKKKINFFFFFKFYYFFLSIDLNYYFLKKILNKKESYNVFFLFFWKNDLFFFYFFEKKKKMGFDVSVCYKVDFSLVYNYLFFNIFSFSSVNEYNLFKCLFMILNIEDSLNFPLFVFLLNFNLDFIVIFNIYFYINNISNVSFFFFEKTTKGFVIFSFFFFEKKFNHSRELLRSSLEEFVKIDNLSLENYVSLFYLGSKRESKGNNQPCLDNYFFFKNIFNKEVNYNSYYNFDDLLNNPLSHLWLFDL